MNNSYHTCNFLINDYVVRFATQSQLKLLFIEGLYSKWCTCCECLTLQASLQSSWRICLTAYLQKFLQVYVYVYIFSLCCYSNGNCFYASHLLG